MGSSPRRVPLVFDIETEADTEWIDRTGERFVERLEPPRNYKKADAINGWVAEQVAARKDEAAKNPVEGRIVACAVGTLWGDHDADIVARVDRKDERDLITWLISKMIELATPIAEPLLAGFAITTFDVPFVTVRAALHQIELPRWWPTNPRRPGAVLDAFEILGREGKLETWLDRFSLPPKLASGKTVPELSDDQLLAYVRQDTLSEGALLRRIAYASAELRETEPCFSDPDFDVKP